MQTVSVLSYDIQECCQINLQANLSEIKDEIFDLVKDLGLGIHSSDAQIALMGVKVIKAANETDKWRLSLCSDDTFRLIKQRNKRIALRLV